MKGLRQDLHQQQRVKVQLRAGSTHLHAIDQLPYFFPKVVQSQHEPGNHERRSANSWE